MGSSHNDKAKFVARYIEGFIDLVENVPNDLSRRVTRLHELQLGYEYSLRKLESNLTRFSRPKGSDIRQLKLLLATQNCLIEMQEISDSKLAILQDALEQLESKSRELDNDFKQIAATSEGTDTTKEQQPSASSSQPKSKTTRESPEPTYCTCHQVSYGDMICCDNDACPIEWFHFQCVSLTTKPKGRWYCPSCRGDRSNQPRKSGLL